MGSKCFLGKCMRFLKLFLMVVSGIAVCAAGYMAYEFYIWKTDPYVKEGRITLLCEGEPGFLVDPDNYVAFRTLPPHPTLGAVVTFVTVPWIGPECAFVVGRVEGYDTQTTIERGSRNKGLLIKMAAIGGILDPKLFQTNADHKEITKALLENHLFADSDMSRSISLSEEIFLGEVNINWLYSHDDFLEGKPYETLRGTARFREGHPVSQKIGTILDGEYTGWTLFAALLPKFDEEPVK